MLGEAYQRLQVGGGVYLSGGGRGLPVRAGENRLDAICPQASPV